MRHVGGLSPSVGGNIDIKDIMACRSQHTVSDKHLLIQNKSLQ